LYRLRRSNGVPDDTAGSNEAARYSGRRCDALLVARAAVGLAIILAQLVFVLTVQLSNCCKDRYFAWAPNDYSIDYRISATVDGRTLSSSEILDRYRLPQVGFYEDPPERLKGVLQKRELAYGGADRVDIVLEYELNGRAPATWRWSNGE
jgi:hypothetical protein